MDELKKLEMQGCRKFVCPNLNLIEEKCKEFNVREDIIEKSKNMAIEYFKRTYHKPHYSSARIVLPAIVYIVSIIEDDKKSQDDIAKIFGVSNPTIRKWRRDVMKVMNIKTLKVERKFKKPKIDADSQFCEIDEEGKALLLKDSTIETAKYLMSRYFKIENFDHHYPRIRNLRSAFIYTASIIENDKRSQYDIYQVSGVNEATISNWHRKIIRALGMKIICHCGHVVTVLEGQYDS